MNFNRFLRIPAIAGAIALASLGTASVAHAGNVFWSVGIASPGVQVGVANAPVYHQPAPAPVYVQPAPVYVQPAPVYYQPAPVYYQPAPVYYRPAPVYRAGYVTPVINGYYYGHRGHGYGHGYNDRNHNGVPDGRERYDNRGGNGRR
ncbi:MAG: hypothetical protein Q8K38_03750 [Burkholderiaceae bacterium]|uniref:hypothetical protein n=1 Tax=Hydrogenophaga sp. TaxID=1904254 RepID=UPI00275FA0E2|nr:hypothetical protein [Hydrogenophaga sp.]MDP2065063.1 hypothetical protein [Burkholderiaceae bacterium]MDZ4144127.1 hypothetical protein [Burkholderiales bacterium]MDZ4396272.1 hypothetical protein [Hydrogenophaga sp.]